MVLKQDQVLGKNVLAATDYYRMEDTIRLLNDVKKLEPKAQLWQTDRDTYEGFLTGAGMPEFAAQELYEAMAFMSEFGYYGKTSLNWNLSVS